ncbi:hypothetical protein BJV82DRAFT_696809 [Fennellomyces sp. T-0311]|nr:hypothetical protein BJV82DRAFT_696809 [Fennellomyces sp. T-0311]
MDANRVTASTEFYPGHTALLEYINQTKNPSLGNFIQRNKSKVAGWSGNYSDYEGLRRAWVSRFETISEELDPGVIPDMELMQESAVTNRAPLKQVIRTLNAEASSSRQMSSDALPDEDERWYHNGVDVTRALIDFRHKAVKDVLKLTKAPTPRRTLALSYVYLFAIDEDESAFPFKSVSMRFNRGYEKQGLGSDAEEWCRVAREALDKNVDADPEDIDNDDDWALASALANNITAAITKKSKNLLCFAEVLYDLATTDVQWVKNLTEDTHVHAHIAPIIKAVFTKDKRLIYHWANTMLEAVRVSSTSTDAAEINGSSADRLLPDFMCSVKVQNRTFNLLALEVKPPKKTGHDLEKLGRELKIMLNVLVKAHVSDPAVCGIHVEELCVRTYQMKLSHNGIYELLELQNVDLITKHSQLGQLPAMVEAVLQTKNIIVRTAQSVKTRILQKLAGPSRICIVALEEFLVTGTTQF